MESPPTQSLHPNLMLTKTPSRHWEHVEILVAPSGIDTIPLHELGIGSTQSIQFKSGLGSKKLSQFKKIKSRLGEGKRESC